MLWVSGMQVSVMQVSGRPLEFYLPQGTPKGGARCLTLKFNG